MLLYTLPYISCRLPSNNNTDNNTIDNSNHSNNSNASNASNSNHRNNDNNNYNISNDDNKTAVDLLDGALERLEELKPTCIDSGIRGANTSMLLRCC